MMHREKLYKVNTSTSYLLRLTIITQIGLVVISSIPRIFKSDFLFYQQAAYWTLFALPALLVITILTPSRPDRRIAKRFDLTSSLLWLSSVGLFLLYALRHCSDC